MFYSKSILIFNLGISLTEFAPIL